MTNTLKGHISARKFDAYQKRIAELKPNIQSQETVQTVSSTVATLTETLPYLELAGYRLERQNHGAPQCPDIALNEQEASWTKPQAWSNEIDGQTCWYYNYPGACAEAKYLGKEIPTIEQWMEMLESVLGNDEEKAQALNAPLAGWRNAGYDEFYYVGGYAKFWSSSPGGDEYAHCAVLERGSADAYRGTGGRGRGVSLRFLSDKK